MTRPEWAGLALVMDGKLIYWQIRAPMGTINIRHDHDMSKGSWTAICEPEYVRSILTVHLEGELGQWDGRHSPTRVVPAEVTDREPLALPTHPWVDLNEENKAHG